MLHALKIKPFDLQPVFTNWTDAPKFNGKEKKDLTVVSWLAKIEEGCKLHRVPKDLWPEVAQHYMGEKATKRFGKVTEVMIQMHGASYTWNWKRFKTAMENAHWELEGNKWLRIVGSKATSVFTRGEQGTSQDKSTKPTAKSSEPRSFLQRTLTTSDKAAVGSVKDTSRPTPPVRASSLFVFSSNAQQSAKPEPEPARTLKKKEPPKEKVVQRPRSNSQPKLSTTVVEGNRIEVPVWLLLACEALKELNVEYPTTMGVVSAILITVGSIPSLPAVSAGAAGTLLASGAAHALGSIAIGLGSLLTAHQQAMKS